MGCSTACGCEAGWNCSRVNNNNNRRLVTLAEHTSDHGRQTNSSTEEKGEQHHFKDLYRAPTNQGGKGVPLFVCLIDFEKAFDRVDREIIWRRLEERGI